MKKILVGFVCICSTIMFFSCEKELHKYEGRPTIYFNEAGRLPAYSGEVIKDSTVLSFGYAKENIQDSTVNMVVKVMGEKQDVDRPYKLVVDATSDAKEGIHYEILNTAFAIKRNNLQDTVRIRFLRREDMLDKTFLLSFSLMENEHFAIEMKDKIINVTTGKKHSFVTYRWFVNDIVMRPIGWFDGYLGTFSRKKLFLMAEVLNIEPAFFNAQQPLAQLLAYAKYMQRYLNEQRAAGNTIYEEDGTTIMVMGASAQ